MVARMVGHASRGEGREKDGEIREIGVGEY